MFGKYHSNLINLLFLFSCCLPIYAKYIANSQGKTRFYYQEYSQTHTRISPRDDYPDKSLHYVVSEAIKRLREGTQVVIDDCNAHEDTRQSYIARVKEGVPHTRTVLVVFRPVHGVRQCEWQLEWNLAARCNVTQRDTNQADQHGTYIDWSAWQKTFEHEPVSLLEGFNSTRYVDSRLYAARPREQFNNAVSVVCAACWRVTDCSCAGPDHRGTGPGRVQHGRAVSSQVRAAAPRVECAARVEWRSRGLARGGVGGRIGAVSHEH